MPVFTGYRAEKMVDDWGRSFSFLQVFSTRSKRSRAVTHLKRLKPGAKVSSAYSWKDVRHLGPSLGPILWQLPPRFPKNTERLTHFLQQLPRRMSHAIEFRHPTWLEDGVGDVVERFGVAKVWVSSLAMPMDFEVTSNFVYLRLHGLDGRICA